jgi:hypothetical protein
VVDSFTLPVAGSQSVEFIIDLWNQFGGEGLRASEEGQLRLKDPCHNEF